MSEPKPKPFTGFMAYHPKHGYDGREVHRDADFAMEVLCIPELGVGPERSSQQMIDDGWKIIQVEVTPK